MQDSNFTSFPSIQKRLGKLEELHFKFIFDLRPSAAAKSIELSVIKIQPRTPLLTFLRTLILKNR